METNTYYYAGIDIGSTTVKLVLLNEAGEMVWGEYRRHCAHTQETLAEMMREARKKLGACRVKVRMTGSGAISLAEALRVGFVQEVVAVAEALQRPRRRPTSPSNWAARTRRLSISPADWKSA